MVSFTRVLLHFVIQVLVIGNHMSMALPTDSFSGRIEIYRVGESEDIVDATSYDPMKTFPDEDSFEQFLFDWISKGERDTLVKTDISTSITTILSDYKLEPESSIGNDTLLDKRATTCNGMNIASVKEHQVAQSGTWWSPWYPVSCCLYSGYSSGGGSITIGYDYTYTWSATAGLELSTDRILSLLGVSVGFSLSASESRSEQYTCNVPGNSVTQIWYQQRMSWGDLQKRDRVVCERGTGYVTPWSKYYRVDAPIKNAKSLGCSSGYDKVQCSKGTCNY